MASKIEWTDETWNPARGCSRVSEGCRNCYAERQARRMAGEGGAYEGLLTLGGTLRPAGRWTGEERLIRSPHDKPARSRKPRRVFAGGR